MIKEIGFGKTKLKVDIPEKNIMCELRQREIPSGTVGAEAVREALTRPIGTPSLKEIVHPGDRIAIVTSDISRPMPTRDVLPAVLDELEAAGADLSDVTVVFALGIHRGHTDDERRALCGYAAYARVQCVDSDPLDTVRLGTTSRGTPVDITRAVAEADIRICLGNVEYHYFAGYSGGAKAIMPGCSTRNAIQNNHRMMTQEAARSGVIEGNPVRADLEEAMEYCPVHFIVNVVLDSHKQILRAFCGHPIEAHREACRALDSVYKIEIPRRADIVIASQGGAPKDLNMYQTQKALDNAAKAVRDGGTIVLVGECPEGMGEKTFEEWLRAAERPSDLTERISRDFMLGGHKAAAIALVVERAHVHLVSAMPPELAKLTMMTPYTDLQMAFDDAMERYGSGASVIVMPNAGSTLPVPADRCANA